MLNVLKVRIYPNKKQEIALAKSFGCSRFVWNYYLNKTNNQYQETGKRMSYCDMARDLTQLKKLPDTDDLITNKQGKISAIDLGLNSLVTVFDGEKCYKVDPIKLTKKYAKRLKRRQQALSRKIKGSLNSKKQVKRVAKVHEKIANTRLDFLHQLSRRLVDKNQVIVAENLCVKGLARTKLAKSLLDAGLGMLLNFIGYKLNREGGKLIKVDRFFPSTKLCNCCKFKNDSLNLSIREWVCPSCQTHHDRDENAAKNVREEGLRILSTNTVGHNVFQACGEDVRLVGTFTKKRFSVKQESPVTAPA